MAGAEGRRERKGGTRRAGRAAELQSQPAVVPSGRAGSSCAAKAFLAGGSWNGVRRRRLPPERLRSPQVSAPLLPLALPSAASVLGHAGSREAGSGTEAQPRGSARQGGDAAALPAAWLPPRD